MLAIDDDPRLQGEHRLDLGEEVERVELEEHVEAEEAVDVEPAGRGVAARCGRRTGRCSR